MIPIIIYVFASLILGSIFCLFGKKLYFPILIMNVYGTIAVIAFSLFDFTLKAVLITAVVGTLAAMLVRFFYRLGVFFIGSILGGGISLVAASFLPPAASEYIWITVLLFAVAMGICAVLWCDVLIMAATAFEGAFAITVPLCFLVMEFGHLQNFIYADGMLATMTNLNQYLNTEFVFEHGTVVFLTTMAVAVGGLLFQIKQNKKDVKR